MASSSHGNVFSVTEKLNLGNHANRWKRLDVLMIINFANEPMSALQEHDVSWKPVDSDQR